MDILSNKQVRQVDKAVIVDAKDATNLVVTLKVKAIALKGKEDYVPTPPKIETVIVEGGHVSPLERPQEVSDIIGRLRK